MYLASVLILQTWPTKYLFLPGLFSSKISRNDQVQTGSGQSFAIILDPSLRLDLYFQSLDSKYSVS